MTTRKRQLLFGRTESISFVCIEYAWFLLEPHLPIAVSSFDRTASQGTLHTQAKGTACGPRWTNQDLGVFHCY